jgi:hypothetical protein
MRNYLLFFLILVVLSCGQQKPVAEQPVKSETLLPAEALQFETESHDFGILKAGEKASFSFVFTNSGDQPIHIKNAKPDCGCLSVRFDNKTVKPGEKGMVEVIFDSAGEFGKQLKNIEIEWNSKELKHLIIFAEVENDQLIINN